MSFTVSQKVYSLQIKSSVVLEFFFFIHSVVLLFLLLAHLGSKYLKRVNGKMGREREKN